MNALIDKMSRNRLANGSKKQERQPTVRNKSRRSLRASSSSVTDFSDVTSTHSSLGDDFFVSEELSSGFAPSNEHAIVTSWIDCLNAKDADFIEDMLDLDAREPHNFHGRDLENHELISYFLEIFGSFPNFEIKLASHVEEVPATLPGLTAVRVEVKARGRHKGMPYRGQKSKSSKSRVFIDRDVLILEFNEGMSRGSIAKVTMQATKKSNGSPESLLRQLADVSI